VPQLITMKIKKIIGIVFFFLIVSLVTLNFYGKYHKKVIYQLSALNCVVEASILYMNETGTPPHSLENLYSNKYLVKNGEWVGIPAMGETMALWQDVNEVSLSFPVSPDELALLGEHLVDKTTKKKFFLITVKPKLLWGVDIDGINRTLWYRWKEIQSSNKASTN
jgi:hypothetical protein